MAINPFGGFVGIGTQTPEAELDVAGTAQVSGDLVSQGDIRLSGNLIPEGDICIGRCGP